MNERMNKAGFTKGEALGVAKAILFMSPMTAHALNMPMTYEEAYEHVFGKNLYERLTELVAEYGDKHIVWELNNYDQGSPAHVMTLLGIWRSFKSTMIDNRQG